MDGRKLFASDTEWESTVNQLSTIKVPVAIEARKKEEVNNSTWEVEVTTAEFSFALPLELKHKEQSLLLLEK